MNLPQNINKSDGAIARSFSQELGLNLDFKTERRVLWQTAEYATSQHSVYFDDQQLFATISEAKLGLWSYKEKRLLRSFDLPFEKTSAMLKLNSSELLIAAEYGNKLIKAGGLIVFNINSGDFYVSEIGQLYGKGIDRNENLLALNHKSDGVLLYDLAVNKSVNKFSVGGYVRGVHICTNRLYLFIPYYADGESRVRVIDMSDNQVFVDIEFRSNFDALISIDNEHNIIFKKGESLYVYDAEKKNARFHKMYVKPHPNYNDVIESAKTNTNHKLLGFNINKREFWFCNSILNANNSEILKFKIEPDNRYREKINWEETEYMVDCYSKSKGIVFHKIKDNTQVVFNSDDSVQDIVYNSNNHCWLNKSMHVLWSYKPEVANPTKMLELKSGWLNNLIYTSDLKLSAWVNEGFLFLFNLETKKYIGQKKLDIAYNNMKTIHDNSGNDTALFFAEQKKTIFLLELLPTNKEDKTYMLQGTELDYELNIKQQKIIDIPDISQKNFSIVQDLPDLVNISPNENYLLLNIANKENRTFYKIFVNDFSVSEIAKICMTPFSIYSYKRNKPLISKNNNLAIVESREGVVLLDIERLKVLGEINSSNNISARINSFFNEKSNLIYIGGKYYTEIYQINPFKHIGNLHFDGNSTFNIELLPNQTSPNGWFYTNAPNKINVLKTKADGSEPELLPVDDEERQAFIKHHNRKDIVLKKLFEPEKYAEFAKLNASAQELASHDMAIELSKAEAKRLKGFDSFQ